jgi:hypothetical protein
LPDALKRGNRVSITRDVVELFSGAEKDGAVADAAAAKGYITGYPNPRWNHIVGSL